MDHAFLSTLARTISVDLQAAERGEKSSFSYIQNPLAQKELVDTDLQVLVIGGSVFKKAIFKRSDGSLHLLSSSQKPQPPFASKDDFLRFFLDELDPSIHDIGVNFAYPLSPCLREGRLDGKLITGMKENRFAGLVGQQVGEEIERAIYEKNGNRMRVAVANDTICLLLSGLSVGQKETLTAGVIGTGINFAFFSGDEAINTEAANFNNFPLSEEAAWIDAHSAMPKSALFEKEVAGAYLFKHYNHYLKKRGLASPVLLQTHELDLLAQKNSEEGDLARGLLTRSAQLTAAMIAGLMLYKKRDLTFVIEGSLFWKGYRFKETVEETVSNVSPEKSAAFIRIANSPLLGAAYLVG